MRGTGTRSRKLFALMSNVFLTYGRESEGKKKDFEK